MNKPLKIKKRKKKLGSYPYLTVVFSITLSLFVIGLFALVFLHGKKLSTVIRENLELHVYLDKNLSPDMMDSLQNAIASKPFVLKKKGKAQIEYISQKEAAKRFIKETGEDFSAVLTENPLRPSLVVKISSKYFEETKMKKISEEIKSMTGVFEVDYPVNLIDTINRNIKIIALIMLSFSLILLFATYLLINNTIKLALYSQRFLIRSMQLVGAKRSFIQGPFLLHATFQGFFSGIIAAGLLFLLQQYTYREIPELSQLGETKNIAIVFGALIAAGIFIGLISSFRAVNKYLKMSLDELY